MNKAGGDAPEYDCSCSADGPPRYVDALQGTAGTWCTCTSRPQLELDAELLLKAFPWDVQKTSVTIESSSWQADNLKWVPVNTSLNGLYPPGGPAGVSGWMISAPRADVTIHEYTNLHEAYSALSFSLRLARIPDYYVTRYIWGVVFLVAMALLVLFVPGDEPDRLGFVQSSFLGIVSLQFILVSSTPVTGYNTKLDNFMVIAMVIVFLAYAWNSVRIGFFDWLDKKHDHLLGDGEAEAAAGGSSGAKVAPDAAAAEAGGAEAQQPKKGRKKIHPCFRMLWCVCAPALSPPRRGARGGCARAPHRGPHSHRRPRTPRSHTRARARTPPMRSQPQVQRGQPALVRGQHRGCIFVHRVRRSLRRAACFAARVRGGGHAEKRNL